ncbi:hypothetical protein GCM10027612_65860 [Microbispora bryophytorum subsp. camponoti]
MVPSDVFDDLRTADGGFLRLDACRRSPPGLGLDHGSGAANDRRVALGESLRPRRRTEGEMKPSEPEPEVVQETEATAWTRQIRIRLLDATETAVCSNSTGN